MPDAQVTSSYQLVPVNLSRLELMAIIETIDDRLADPAVIWAPGFEDATRNVLTKLEDAYYVMTGEYP